MNVFLSYASEDRGTAADIRHALEHDGHDVFFDRDDLPPGEDFHARIRRGIEKSSKNIEGEEKPRIDLMRTGLDVMKQAAQDAGQWTDAIRHQHDLTQLSDEEIRDLLRERTAGGRRWPEQRPGDPETALE